ncbi:NAD-dependent DNA ligase [Pontiella sulfatireligans]|uniref:DNA ligase (NAD(+)) n=1 Tax=Pontiella sulfatireligans TaxID=2750658 RepID=A0A6C2UQN1_9BACT|nr:hypothetical protein [Pontiella sulfatireligans]VGO22602.1 DNA ligase [Pontiella sulfatireligans]
MQKLLIFFTALQLSCAAAPPAVEQQVANLQLILQQADEAYYNRSKSLMSDAAYDALQDQHHLLITKYPELAAPPRLGAPPAQIKSKITHTAPVLSLHKAYSDDAVIAFIEKCGTNQLYCIEPKLDGLTVVMRYSDGLLAQATTRGDGKIGIDITAAILASVAVPAKLTNAPPQLEVRAEALLSFPAFTKLNQRRTTAGQAPLKSPRNTAAGTLRLLDYAEIANRGLSIRAFALLHTEPMPATHTEALALLNSTGLPAIESHTVQASEVIPTIESLNQQRAKSPFPTDGIVIRVDDLALFEQLGSTAHHPRGALARKYKEKPKETILLSIEWSKGSTGKLTPIAHFKPIEIQGATIKSATLHNLNHIRAMDLKIGDHIQVIRAGGAVPEILGICPNKRTGKETEVPTPPQN